MIERTFPVGKGSASETWTHQSALRLDQGLTAFRVKKKKKCRRRQTQIDASTGIFRHTWPVQRISGGQTEICLLGYQVSTFLYYG